ncbi:class I SAM-dependent methyltransferase [Sediminimonas qiaohouensis]|uniref:class I SAM-dependent methyltransferase n=1 Tax=Sediminimonas qiaohouensis TaxID=552061 RepID=UPI001FDFA46B|nr:class I SAM-dependent methyltransferase [Sediminimonas qiaohouensis]
MTTIIHSHGQDTHMSTDAAFWDKIAAKYAARKVGNPTAYEETLAETIAHLGANDRVLELGCGTGTTALKLAPHVKSMVASDISTEMIAIAEQKRQAEGAENVRFVAAGLAEAGADEGPFDTVLAFNLLHLVADLDEALATIHARIRPGGLFISKSGCIGEMNVLFRPLIRAMQLIGRAPYVRIMKKPELEAAIVGAGFVLEQSRCFTGAPESLYIVARRP